MNENLNDWLTLTKRSNVVNNLFTETSQLADMIKARSITNNFAVTSMLSQVGKAASISSNIFEIKKTVDLLIQGPLTGFNTYSFLTEKFFDTIYSIGNRQNDFIEKISRNPFYFGSHNSLLTAKLNNLQFTLGAISGGIASISTHQRNWTILDDFKKINDEVISISESIIEETITEDQKLRLQEIVEQIVTFIKKNKKIAISTLFLFL